MKDLSRVYDSRVIESIDAVTLETADMRAALRFYLGLGFTLRYGGDDAAFTSLHAGSSYLNLELRSGYERQGGWGRVIFHVGDVDAVYERAIMLGYPPSTAPKDATWGERYFHISDPDGHELSFARLLQRTIASEAP